MTRPTDIEIVKALRYAQHSGLNPDVRELCQNLADTLAATPEPVEPTPEQIERAARVAYPDAFGKAYASEDYRERCREGVRLILRAALNPETRE